MIQKTKIIVRSDYYSVLSEVVDLLNAARSFTTRSINSVMSATYWLIGKKIIEFEQRGRKKADYGKMIINRLAEDLSSKFGRGFGRSNLFQMRAFYLEYAEKVQTPSGQFHN